MDTEKIIIYVAIGLAYYGYKYFFKNFGKSQEPPKPVINRPSQNPNADTWSNPPPKESEERSSIFDLLEEIKKQEAAKQQAPKKQTPTIYKTLEETNYELEPQKVIIENTDPYKYQASSIKKDQKDSNTRSLSSEEYSTKTKPHPLLSILKDQRKIKDAFILGEILTKKY